jgi:hypothetical protein
MKAAGPEPILDGASPEPELQELFTGDRATLIGRQFSGRLVTWLI